MTKVYLSRAITGVIALLFDLQCSALVVRAWVYIQDLGSRFGGRGGRPNGLRPWVRVLPRMRFTFDYASC